MNVRHRVELSQTERADLTALLSGGKHAARKLKRAQILLAADTGASDDDIATNVGVGGSTVYRTKQRFVLGNLEAALSEAPRPGASRKLSSKEEALLVATACSKPPQGRARWTLELLAGELVSLTEHASVSRETVRRRLAENHLKPWRKDMWCIPQVDGEYVARMEDVLDLYAEVSDPKCPVVCFDESPTQLIGEVRQPIPAKPGQIERSDCEYKRNGTVNLFVFLDAHRPWRKVKVTERRAAEDYAQCMRELVDIHYPDAEYIRVVQDNLSTHSAGALYQTFPPAEARRILRRLEFHYTPKHASWLNMVEIDDAASLDLSECAVVDGWLTTTRRTRGTPTEDHGPVNWDSSSKLPTLTPIRLRTDSEQNVDGQVRQLLYFSGMRSITGANDPFWNMRAFQSAMTNHSGYISYPLMCSIFQFVMDKITEDKPATVAAPPANHD